MITSTYELKKTSVLNTLIEVYDIHIGTYKIIHAFIAL